MKSRYKIPVNVFKGPWVTSRYLFLFAIIVFQFLFHVNFTYSQFIRQDILLNSNWKTFVSDSLVTDFNSFQKAGFDDDAWEDVNVPHNWDKYEGFRRLRHGNRHGYAWYRKTIFVEKTAKDKRYFLFFEGVGSYATVWLNGKKVGSHAGGRTTFTLDITNEINLNSLNILAVRADHPSMIRDLPWVCGGCSDEWGFSEGSQPFGIFRNVHLIKTNQIRIEPFGIHIWNDDKISHKSAVLNIDTEIKNYSTEKKNVVIVNKLFNSNKLVCEIKNQLSVNSRENRIISCKTPEISDPHLWSIDDPFLYQLVSEIYEDKTLVDSLTTPYGIRWISWPIGKEGTSNQFLLNGKPVFINGISEYEHNMGQSHSFSDGQILARINQVRAAGFNAFRDAHQPHNLLYQKHLDEYGLLWWPQFAAHIWFDTPEFRNNFKTLLRDWVKERRNSPSLILWGLENESSLPLDFAKECSDIIRQLDPTTSSQRKITTCNGGVGTDWNVVQNWSGTYGGNPENYDQELKKQLLNGEYGAWRSIDLHTEGPFVQNGENSEDRMSLLMESKIRLGESVKDSSCGQFMWLLNSHENPGRVQNGEGLRDIDRIGPVNYKGLLTAWGEPTDAYYMFMSNYVDRLKTPMVYIVSHTWPNRWTMPGIKDSIVIYSNCYEVELFNDIDAISLGKMKRKGIGTHFQWDSIEIKYNVLYAKGYVDGKEVATDIITLNHLPESPSYTILKKNKEQKVSSQKNYNYLYRVNCGGPEFIDSEGYIWMADVHKSLQETWGSTSWTDDFKGLPPFYASQRRTFDPISGTSDWKLFQSFRYGLDKLQYEFPLPNGIYLVELYFIEPWYGTGSRLNYSGWRVFDVAINDSLVIDNFDIWKEAGHDKLLKKSVLAHVSDNKLVISFPEITAGQAVISAIAIASKDPEIKPAPPSPSIISNLALNSSNKKYSVQHWMDMGDIVYSDDSVAFSHLPPELYGADWIRFSRKNDVASCKFRVSDSATVFLGISNRISEKPSWINCYVPSKTTIECDLEGGTKFNLYSKRFGKDDLVALDLKESYASQYIVAAIPATSLQQTYDLRPLLRFEAEKAEIKGKGIAADTLQKKTCVKLINSETSSIEWQVSLGLAATYMVKLRYVNNTAQSILGMLEIIAEDGRIINSDKINFFPSEKWKSVESSTGGNINAGKYKFRLSFSRADNLFIDVLEIQ